MRRRWLAALLPISLGVVVVACATRNAETVRTLDTTSMERESWVGYTQDRLRETWGEPYQTERSADGSDVWTYRHVFIRPVNSPSILPTPSIDPGDSLLPVETKPDATPDFYEDAHDVARFWFDDDGRVAREWVDMAAVREIRKRGAKGGWKRGNATGEVKPQNP